MKNRIVCLWQKLPVGKRRTLAVLALTLLIHAVLLVLFRQAPAQAISVQRELPRVQTVDLTDPENQSVAQWMNLHDPSATLLPDRRHGFSRMLNNFNAHPVLEDMPTLPPLSLPNMPERAKLERKRTERKNVFPAATHWQSIPESESTSGNTVRVWFNGSRHRTLEELLAAVAKNKSAADPTCLTVPPARLQGLVCTIELKSSCGNKDLDSAALSAVNNFFENNPQYRREHDRITILWPSAEVSPVKQGAEI